MLVIKLINTYMCILFNKEIIKIVVKEENKNKNNFLFYQLKLYSRSRIILFLPG